MPSRCGCASDRCSCFIIGGDNISVTGAGTAENPLVISGTTVVINEGGEGTPTPVSNRLPGEMVLYGGVTAPTGWLLCTGQAVSRVVYSDLFGVIGTRFGAGDGATTFNVPSPADKYLIGASGSKPVGSSGGSGSVSLTTAHLPAHTHSMDHSHGSTSSGGNHDHPLQRSAAVGSSNANIPRGTTTTEVTGTGAIMFDGAHTHNVPAHTGSTGSTGTGSPVTIDPSRLAFNLLIKT